MTPPRPYVTAVTAVNLKDKPSLHVALSQLTLITGANGSGKTTVVNALELASLGYIPWLGNTGPATAKMAGPGLTLAVEIEMNGPEPRSIRRSWKRTATGLSSTEKPADGEKLLPVYSLDTAALLKMKPAEMTQAIALRYGVTGDPKTAIIAELKKILGTEPVPTVKATEFAEWLDGMSDAFGEKLKEARATIKRMKGTVEGSTALDESTSEPYDGKSAALAQNEAGAAASRLEAAKANVERLRTILAGLPAAGATITPPEKSAANLRTERAEIVALIEPLAARATAAKANASHLETTRKLLASLEEQAEGLGHELDQNPEPEKPELYDETFAAMPPGSYETTRAAAEKCRLDLAKATAEAEAVPTLAADASECPCCGAVKAAWSEQKIWDAEQVKIDRDNAKSKAEKALEEATDRANRHAVTTLYLASVAHRAALVAEQKKVEASITETEARLASIPVFSPDDAEELAGLESELEPIDEALATWAKIEENGTDKAAEVSQALTTAEAEVETYEELATAAKAKAEKAEAAAQAAAESKAAADLRDKARAEYNKAKASETMFAAALDKLKAEAERLTKEIFEPLLATARRITAGCLPTELANRGLEFGRFDGPHFISILTFSKSEQLAALAGISAALADAGEGIAIIDEFNNMDADKRPRMLANLAEAILDGTIAQAIVLDNSKERYNINPALGSVVEM